MTAVPISGSVDNASRNCTARANVGWQIGPSTDSCVKMLWGAEDFQLPVSSLLAKKKIKSHQFRGYRAGRVLTRILIPEDPQEAIGDELQCHLELTSRLTKECRLA